MSGGDLAPVRLEPLAPIHAAALHAALGRADVWQYLDAPVMASVAATEAWVARVCAGAPAGAGVRWWNFAIVESATGEVCGHLQATVWTGWAEVAYLLGPAWWGRGLARAAVAWLLVRLAEHGCAEAWAAVHASNRRSRRLLEALGFTLATPRAEMASHGPADVCYRLELKPSAPT